MKFLKKLGVSILATVISLIPFWVFLGIKSIASPEGFWQNLTFVGVGVYFFGGVQFLLGVGLTIYLFFLWFGDQRSGR